MRVRARRRLAGAVALVLAAVIVLPMLLDSEPKPIPASVQITVPGRDTPFKPNLTTPPAVASSDASGVLVPLAQDAQGAVAPSGQGTTQATPAEVPKSAENTGTNQAHTTTDPKPEPKPQPNTATQTKPRTDDGSRALALLEGRAPTSGAAAPSGGSGFVVQVASYSTQADANGRRDKLRSEGVTNAFVESTSVNGKPTFRLRVGPFGSRDAAQAAQTRLRALGYPNGFIATQ